MSFRVVRTSKFRHVFGQQKKKEDCLDGLRISRNAWDSAFCSVNPSFLGVVLEAQGGGSFMVIPHSQTGKVSLDYPTVSGHTAAVLDIQFCPYDDHLIASASEDCTVKVWRIPEGGLPYDPKNAKNNKNMMDAVATLVGHQRRVGIVEWHPTAKDILLSAGFDYLLMIWDISTGKCLREINCHTDTIFSMTWNFDGSLLATACKDHVIRVINPRTGSIVQQSGVGKAHEGSKSMRVVWCGEQNKIFSTGFSKVSERQYAIWEPTAMDSPLTMEVIDSGTGGLFPYYDNDLQIVYVAGKGDGNIRYFEIDGTAPYCHFLSEYKTSTPQRGLGWLPKRGIDVTKCEIARCYKLTPKGSVEIVEFIVPRKSTMFQDDIFPPTKVDVSSVSGANWWAGQNGGITKISLKDGFVATHVSQVGGVTVQSEDKPVAVKIPVVQSAPSPARVSTPVQQVVTPVSAEDKAPSGNANLEKAWREQKDEIKRLNTLVAALEEKIKRLE